MERKTVSLVNERGERRGYIDFLREYDKPQLKELWFMWSLCNLECTHCYVGSNPKNNILQMITLSDAEPFLKEARSFEVEDIYFTGGEPFANKELPNLITESIKIARVTILTNGLGPIEKNIDFIDQTNREFPEKLTLRISLDHFIPEEHDKIRGSGSFQKTVKNANELLKRGVKVIITATPVMFDNSLETYDAAVERFQKLFISDVEVKLIPFTLQMGSELSRKPQHYPEMFITERHMRSANPVDFQCYYGRTVQKINNVMRVYPCPIIYNDDQYELGVSLKDSFERIYLAHHGCYWFCFKNRGKCGNKSNGSA
ncbi:MAG: radical SAM protein [Planctomycetes bacterium]|nr:radical SAM protein [Planctomycetota bacterium]